MQVNNEVNNAIIDFIIDFVIDFEVAGMPQHFFVTHVSLSHCFVLPPQPS